MYLHVYQTGTTPGGFVFAPLPTDGGAAGECMI